MEEEFPAALTTHSPSPPAAANSPRSDEGDAVPTTTAPIWSAGDEAAAVADYCAELADFQVYELMRHFAKATRAITLYDTQACLNTLDKLPPVHQRTPWVMAMVGRAHYERTEYASVSVLSHFQAYIFTSTDVRVYSNMVAPHRPNARFSPCARSNRIACGIWKSIRRSCGICRSLCSFLSLRRSCSPSMRARHRHGLRWGTPFRPRRSGRRR
jgi:anaphase-promoting complex subunit 3